MLRTILIYGVFAGLVVIVPMSLLMVNSDFGEGDHGAHSMITGYALMLLAFSLIFVGLKRYRDHQLGGVIRFVPALLGGLAIAVIGSLIYVVGWEITLAATDYAFMNDYAAAMMEQARAKGASASELAALGKQMDGYKEIYANPLARMAMTFVEPFPVGVIVSVITAVLLRNSRFWPLKVQTVG
jgi:hypothetical protein